MYPWLAGHLSKVTVTEHIKTDNHCSKEDNSCFYLHASIRVKIITLWLLGTVVSLMGSMRWGKKENTVRTQAALAREWGELKRSMNNGKPGREKPGAVRCVRATSGGSMLFPGRAAHLPGNSNGSSQMKHECCQISAVVFCEAGLPRRGWGRHNNFFSPRRTLERVLTVPTFLRRLR